MTTDLIRVIEMTDRIWWIRSQIIDIKACLRIVITSCLASLAGSIARSMIHKQIFYFTTC